MRLDHFGLTEFFQGAGGSRPGLAMRITDLHIDPGKRRRRHRLLPRIPVAAGRRKHERLSTVVYEKTPGGALLWRHLHETWVA